MAAIAEPSALPWAARLRDLSVPLSLGAVKLIVHLLLIRRYGHHRDELYFIECAERLDLGYVDHAPLVPWIARLVGAPFGYDLAALRLPAVLAGAVLVFLTALLAKRLGGGGFAQLLAGLSAIAAPAYMRMAKILCIPIFEQLFWTVCALLLVRIATTRPGREAAGRWLVLGVIAGLGLLNKHSMLIWGAAAFTAIVLTPSLRKHLRTPWPWLAGALSLVIFAPNVYWQATHDWATVRFLTNMSEGLLSKVPRAIFLAGNVLYMNPLTLPVWGAGLIFFFSREGREQRALGIIFVTALAILLLTHGKPYYLAPAYPPLFAAGGVWLERRISRQAGRIGLVGAIAAGTLLLAPVGLPLAPIGVVDAGLESTLGAIVPPTDLTHDLHDEHGWPERADAMEAAFLSLPAEEREGALILTANYGEASSLRFFGEGRLPPVASGHMNWHLWGLPVTEPSVVLVDGLSDETRARLFESCEEVGRTEHPEAMAYENHAIYACRGATRPLDERWPELRRFSHGHNVNDS